MTFTQNVAPLLFKHCASCHRPDRAAPFSLLTYEDARKHATDIVAATTARRMPPWLPKHGVNDFIGERWLADEEIATLRRWVESGTPLGDPADLPASPTEHVGWQLGNPDLIVSMSVPYQLPQTKSDIYRNFVMPVSIAERCYVRAVELWPDNTRVIHHAVITVDRTRWSRYRDEQDREPGYDGMLAGQAESPDGHFIAWTPGRLITPEPENMAWRLDRGSDLVLQLHMMPTERPESVSVKVGLFLTKHAPTRFPLMLRIGPTGIDIAGGRRQYSAQDQFVLPVDVEALSVYPHAHNLARTMTASARLPDGAVRPLLEIPRWDFHWQDEYRYEKPLVLPRGTTIAMRYMYDNSSDNHHNPQHPSARVVYGPRTSDEMADLWLQVLPATAADRATLAAALAERETLAQIKGAETTLLARPDDVITRTLLASLYAHVGRITEAEREYRRAIAIDPVAWPAYYNLGAALQSSGRPEAALSEYRSALAINPNAAEAHHAIGTIAYLAGRLDEAMREFREALQIWGDYADAHNSLGNALAKVGRNADAVGEYRTVLNIQPDHVPALNNLGILLARLGEIDEAVRVLQRAVEIAPTDRTSLTNLTAARDLARARRKQ